MDQNEKPLQASRIEYLAVEDFDRETHQVGELHFQNGVALKVERIDIVEMAAGLLRFILCYVETDAADDDTGEVLHTAQNPPRRGSKQFAWAGNYTVAGLK